LSDDMSAFGDQQMQIDFMDCAMHTDFKCRYRALQIQPTLGMHTVEGVESIWMYIQFFGSHHEDVDLKLSRNRKKVIILGQQNGERSIN